MPRRRRRITITTLILRLLLALVSRPFRIGLGFNFGYGHYYGGIFGYRGGFRGVSMAAGGEPRGDDPSQTNPNQAMRQPTTIHYGPGVVHSRHRLRGHGAQHPAGSRERRRLGRHPRRHHRQQQRPPDLGGRGDRRRGGAIAGGTLGNCLDNQKGTIYRSPQEAATNVVVQQVPPTPPPPAAPADVVVTPPPSPSAIWIPGYWAFNGSSYVWTTGRWEIPPPDCHAYVAPYWARRSQRLRLYPGLLALNAGIGRSESGHFTRP